MLSILLYRAKNLFIQAFEGSTTVAKPARDLLLSLDAMPSSAVTSELTLAELFAPTRAAGGLSVSEEIEPYEALLERGSILLVPISGALLKATAILRPSYPRKLPDAIHVVTAMQAGCRFAVSNDRDAKRTPPTIERVRPDQRGVHMLVQTLRG